MVSSSQGHDGFLLAPSILSANFAALGDEVRSVIAAGADWVHFDVMDNHYVPNLTIGPLVCEALRPVTNAPIDVHLMVQSPDSIIPAFAKAGANVLTVHPEATQHLDRTLSLIRELGCRAGVALNPATPLSCLEHIMHRIDLILVMSVNPGFGGQSFIQAMLPKITQVRTKVNEHRHQGGQPIVVQVDGGVKVDNIASIGSAGANCFVAGSAIFGQADYTQVITNMRAALGSINPKAGI